MRPSMPRGATWNTRGRVCSPRRWKSSGKPAQDESVIDRIAADGEDPREYVDVILKVSERRFAAWPRHIRQVFEPARTVQAGAQSFRLTTDPAGDA